jgi:dGTP triphosphohydrolase
MEDETMPGHYEQRAVIDTRERAVCDYIAGMSDHYAVMMFRLIFIPSQYAQ